MDIKRLKDILNLKGEAFIKDDFLEAAIRLVWDGKETSYFLKHYRQKEVSIHSSSKTAFDIILGGEETTKEIYQRL